VTVKPQKVDAFQQRLGGPANEIKVRLDRLAGRGEAKKVGQMYLLPE
jgi:hypothetical protein